MIMKKIRYDLEQKRHFSAAFLDTIQAIFNQIHFQKIQFRYHFQQRLFYKLKREVEQITLNKF